jgi:hypothetical protein
MGRNSLKHLSGFVNRLQVSKSAADATGSRWPEGTLIEDLSASGIDRANARRSKGNRMKLRTKACICTIGLAGLAWTYPCPAATPLRTFRIAAVHARRAKDLFTPAEVGTMTGNRFLAAYDKRHGDDSEAGYDDAARFYAGVKQDIDDRAAARISPAAAAQIRALRAAIDRADRQAFTASWTDTIDTLYLHTANRWCMDREDAIARVVRVLARPDQARSKRALLAKLGSLDTKIGGHVHPYHALAARIASLPSAAIAIVLDYERKTVVGTITEMAQ